MIPPKSNGTNTRYILCLMIGLFVGRTMHRGQPSLPMVDYYKNVDYDEVGGGGHEDIEPVGGNDTSGFGKDHVSEAAHQQLSRNDSTCASSSFQHVNVNSVCRCFWERTSQSPHTPMTCLWKSEMMRDGLRRASLRSIKDCWNWEGAEVALENFTNLEDTMIDRLNQHRLPRSIKVPPHPFVMERVLEIILKRMQDPSNHPPLRIAVFGGSVTEGYRSRANSIGMSQSQLHHREMCNWSTKLERLLNQVLPSFLFGDSLLDAGIGRDSEEPAATIVEVRNFAVSATDSSVGVILMDYALLGADMTKTDIVISAFAANDLQAPIGMDRDLITLHMQRFLKSAKAMRPCSDLPLLIQIADVFEESLSYIKGGIRDKLRYHNEMLETTNWAGVMALSYPDAVRDVLYRDLRDDTLMEYGELHPGMSFHIGIAWMITYGLLEGILHSCDASSLADHGKSEPRAGVSFPILRDDLSAAVVPEKWREETKGLEERCSLNQTTPTTCSFKMIAHMLGAANADQVRGAIQGVATNIKGWDGYGYPVRKPRRTWKAMHQNATFTIQLDNLNQPINRMLVLYIKSYGIEWGPVRLELLIEGKLDSRKSEEWIELKRLGLTGFHDSQTSINYSEQIDLGSQLQVGSSVRATFTLVQGNQFQINGLAICHSYQPIESFT